MKIFRFRKHSFKHKISFFEIHLQVHNPVSQESFNLLCMITLSALFTPALNGVNFRPAAEKGPA